MINKPANYDTTEAVIGGGSKRLPLANYICKIVQVVPTMSKKGANMLKIAYDIADGDFTDYYMNQFKTMQERAKKEGKDAPKWPFNATHYIMTDGDFVGRFKGFIKCLEESNPNFTFAWDETKMAGLLFAGQMKSVPREYNGKTYTDVRLANIYPISEFDTMPDAYAENPKDDGFTGGGFGSTTNTDDIPF